MAMDDGSFTGRVWLKMFAVLLGIGIAVILVLVFISGALARWGFVGGFIVIGAVLLEQRGSTTSAKRRRTPSGARRRSMSSRRRVGLNA